MKIKLLDFGLKKPLERKHYDDAGVDVSNKEEIRIKPGQTKKVPLGFGVELSPGFAGFIVPRSGLSSKGLTTELAPVDSSYRGEIHAIITLQQHFDEKIIDNEHIFLENDELVIKPNTRIAQFVVTPIILADFVEEVGKVRDKNGFGSTGL